MSDVDIFEPKGVASQRKLVEDFLAEVGGATNAEIAAIADCHVDNVGAIVHAINEKTERLGFRLITTGGGYRIATAAENLAESTQGRAKKFQRQAKRGRLAANAAGMHPEATPDERKRAADAAAAWAEAERIARKNRARVRPLRPELPTVKRSNEL